MQKIKEVLFGVHQKYLYVALLAMFLTTLTNVWGGIEWGCVPFLFIAFVLFGLGKTDEKKSSYVNYALAIALAAIVTQIPFWVFHRACESVSSYSF